jgi:hypothetical protein
MHSHESTPPSHALGYEHINPTSLHAAMVALVSVDGQLASRGAGQPGVPPASTVFPAPSMHTNKPCMHVQLRGTWTRAQSYVGAQYNPSAWHAAPIVRATDAGHWPASVAVSLASAIIWDAELPFELPQATPATAERAMQATATKIEPTSALVQRRRDGINPVDGAAVANSRKRARGSGGARGTKLEHRRLAIASAIAEGDCSYLDGRALDMPGHRMPVSSSSVTRALSVICRVDPFFPVAAARTIDRPLPDHRRLEMYTKGR